MSGSMSTTRMRLGRLADERERTNEKIEDALALAEEEQRDLTESEQQHLERYRAKVVDLDGEITLLVADLERAEASKDVSALVRGSDDGQTGGAPDGPLVYRTFAQYARDELIVRFPTIASLAAGNPASAGVAHDQAEERLKRVLQHTLTADVQGLLPPTHMAQIMDIINSSRPVIANGGRSVNLATGKLTYPRITGRPDVQKQATEKTQAGTTKMQITLDQLAADTFLGGGNLSWQVINWSTPDALQLWFDLAAEDYARETETAACSELGTAGGGTITTPLGTVGTETFAQWRAAVLAGIKGIYNATGGRAQTNTLYLAADRFFQLAGLGTDQVLQVSQVGSLDIATMTGSWSGLRVVGSYGFSATPSAAIIGDSGAFLVGETPGSPVEMRAVEPAIGGMEVGVIGAFKSKVFDPARFIHLS